jgi:hypothetical protein
MLHQQSFRGAGRAVPGFSYCTKYYACLTWDIFRHCPPLVSVLLSATSIDFEPMQSPEFMACCFCNKPTKAVSVSLVGTRFAHPECYIKHVKARRREIPAARKATPPRWETAMKVRAILWTVTMAYTGFLLTGQGLRTFNSLSITEGFLGAVTGFLLAVMFTLRQRRRQRPAWSGQLQ